MRGFILSALFAAASMAFANAALAAPDDADDAVASRNIVEAIGAPDTAAGQASQPRVVERISAVPQGAAAMSVAPAAPVAASEAPAVSAQERREIIEAISAPNAQPERGSAARPQIVEKVGRPATAAVYEPLPDSDAVRQKIRGLITADAAARRAGDKVAQQKAVADAVAYASEALRPGVERERAEGARVVLRSLFDPRRGPLEHSAALDAARQAAAEALADLGEQAMISDVRDPVLGSDLSARYFAAAHTAQGLSFAERLHDAAEREDAYSRREGLIQLDLNAEPR
jgi:hypothetical protein